MRKPTIALLLSTYNWPEALTMLLEQINRQTVLPDEVIIADDGSSKDTKTVIEAFTKQTNSLVHHVWQPDEGFRKSKILNEALSKVTADYIVQIDGDILMHPNFIADHLRFAKKGQFLYGSRVALTAPKTAQVLAKGVRFSPFSKGLKRRTRAVYLPFVNSFGKADSKLSPKLRGCNISYWHADALLVNGYNEDFEGWGNEDSEFALRLLNAGVNGKRIKHAAIAFHLWHKERSMDKAAFNQMLEENVRAGKLTTCKNGIKKLDQ